MEEGSVYEYIRCFHSGGRGVLGELGVIKSKLVENVQILIALFTVGSH